MGPFQLQVASFALFLIGIGNVGAGSKKKSGVVHPTKERYPVNNDCRPSEGIPNISNYIQWRMTNLLSWSAQDGQMLLQNASDISITNLLFMMDCYLKDTLISGLLEKTQSTCVEVDFESGRINVAISYLNATLSGQYNVNGTLLDSIPIKGEGDWAMGFDIKCRFQSSFEFNTTTKKMQLFREVKFHKERGFFTQTFARCSVISSERVGRERDHGAYSHSKVGYTLYVGQRGSIYYRFEGSLGSTIPESMEEEIKRVLATQVSPYMRYYSILQPLTDRIKSILKDNLGKILEEKTIFQMLDFDLEKQNSPDNLGTIPLRGKCNSTDQCKGSYTDCRLGICKCALGYLPRVDNGDLCGGIRFAK